MLRVRRARRTRRARRAHRVCMGGSYSNYNVINNIWNSEDCPPQDQDNLLSQFLRIFVMEIKVEMLATMLSRNIYAHVYKSVHIYGNCYYKWIEKSSQTVNCRASVAQDSRSEYQGSEIELSKDNDTHHCLKQS